MTKLYVDLDGVLADFDTQYNTMFDEGRYDPILWKNIESVERWFFNLPLMKDATVLLDFLKGHPYGFKILTATGNNYEDVSKQKVEWCKVHLNLPPEQVITVTKGIEKAKYAESRWDILIDDTQKVIDAWRAAGGTGILHTSAEDTIEQLKRFQ
jgi:hypothetical protein